MSSSEQAVKPESFAFSPDNQAKAKQIIARYPAGKQASAVLPLLDLAQRQHGGWLPRAAMNHVAGLLDMAAIRVYEVATFYTMFNLAPVGAHMVRVCTTTPCALSGCDAIVDACCRELGIGLGQTTADGVFTLQEVECLGACVNGPVVWIDDDYFEDVEPDSMRRILRAYRDGETPRAGSQSGRQKSAPAGGLTTLTSTADG